VKKQHYYFWTIVILSIIVFLWVTLEVITSSYDHQDVIKRKTGLMQENRKLNIEYTKLTSPAKIESYAKENFGLNQPTDKQFRYMTR